MVQEEYGMLNVGNILVIRTSLDKENGQARIRLC
jgi:hypothetical protein